MIYYQKTKKKKRFFNCQRNLIFSIFIILMVFVNIQVKAQDPQFSQFYSNPLYLNPALTGTGSFPRIISNYRNQWPSVGNTFVTYNLSYDKYFLPMKAGIGFQLLYDRELNGVINTIQSSFSYSYHIKASDRLHFSTALQAGFILKKFNTDDLIFPGMINQENGIINGSYPLPVEPGQKIVPDFSFGISGQMDEIYFGGALHHLTRPNQSILEGDQVGRLPLKMTLHAGAMMHRSKNMLFSKEFTLSPNMIYQQQGSFKQLNIGMYAIASWMTFGLWYRNNLSIRPDAAIFMIGYTNPIFHLGYSFDFNLSETSVYSYGSHELSLIFYLERNHPKRFYYDTMQIPPM